MGKVFVVIGLHFGDEGKGTTVDCLSNKFSPTTIVRYCGGHQAAHNVITPDGIHHTFSQLGSGMFVPGTRTVLGPEMLIEPAALMYEEEIFRNKVNRIIYGDIFIDQNCTIVTPFHRCLGRILALSWGKSTCGLGVGSAAFHKGTSLSITVKDIFYTKLLREKLKEICAVKLGQAAKIMKEDVAQIKLFQETSSINIEKIIDIYNELIKRYRIIDTDSFLRDEIKYRNLIFEGSQGILLDNKYGFSPYITKCNVSAEDAEKLIKGLEFEEKKIIGVLRPYSHRHGAGPLPTETSKINCKKEEHNVENKWQGQFRYGYFDSLLTNYAIRCAPVDYLSITNMDRIDKNVRVCVSYNYKYFKSLSIDNSQVELLMSGSSNEFNEYVDIEKDLFIDYIENTFKPVKIVSSGPTFKDKVWRQNV